MVPRASILALLIFVLIPPITTARDHHGFRGTLTRIHQLAPGKHSEAVRRDSRRIDFLSYTSTVVVAATNPSASAQGVVKTGGGAYHMNLSMGTPPLTFPVIVDTGSSLIWTQCAPCTKCFPQPTPLFQPSSSSTFSKLPCDSSFCQSLPDSIRKCNATGCIYDYHYGIGYTAGYLATETLSVGEKSSFRNVTFGCSTENGGPMDNTSGIVGLGRRSLSLVSQLGVGRFSYCLSSDPAGSSPIMFGSVANVTGTNVQSTPLVENPVAPGASYYYVNLTGITVGATDLPITSSTFGFASDGTGGTIVDSGATMTYLAEAGYAMVKEAFLSQMGNQTRVNDERIGLDVCFTSNGGGDVPVPRLVLRFAGAEYAVPRKGYFDAAAVDKQGRVVVECLMVLPPKGNISLSIIGNMMQMDKHVLYDLDGRRFSFAPADCAKV
uniref:Peptidase A1 domain-containing protein n=1 Tax=Leersia perrieri TaxID=77586 RepID=A0A0D9WZS9_9ORYZ